MTARPDLAERVDTRWNHWLDLAQADDAPRPCTTFREALDELSSPPTTEAERALVETIEVPSADTVLGAGVAPDGSCDGLAEAFAAATAVPTPAAPARHTRTRKPARSRATAKPTRPKKTAPVVTPLPSSSRSRSKNKDRSVASRLEDDIKGVGF